MTDFQRLAKAFFVFLHEARLPVDPQPISHIEEELAPRLDQLLLQCRANAFLMKGPSSTLTDESMPVGLNTVGMLVDRLTILCIGAVKRGRQAAWQDPIIAEIIAALDRCRPGLSSVNTKITPFAVVVEEQDFYNSAFRLLLTNTVLWEAQEVLYRRGADSLEPSELRAYLRLFSRENIRRNALMERLAELYWLNSSPQGADE
jgi:hypothetical protein